MLGIVLKSTGSWYNVILENKIIVEARLKGGFRQKDIKTTNPICVGDKVELKLNHKDYQIESIYPRKNFIERKSVKKSSMTHLLASNIDEAVLMVSISKPRTSNGFIDRFLVSAESMKVNTTIVFNKIDILTKQEIEILNQWSDVYKKIGYKVFEISCIEQTGIEQLKEHLSYKTIIVAGHSGVGKSTFLNQIESNLNLKTSEISMIHEKGKHTTTFSQMHHLSSINSYIIDTPGIKEFGIVNIDKNSLKFYFKEFNNYLNKCKFSNCMHLNEPNCSLVDDVENGSISEFRYNNYLNILDSI